MDNTVEEKFEQWRHYAIHNPNGCPEALKRFVWNTTTKACLALRKSKAVKAATHKMGRTQLDEFHNELLLLFLEFFKAYPEKSIGWCFVSFKLRLPDAITQIEAKRLGIAVSGGAKLQSRDNKKLRADLQASRLGKATNPIIDGLYTYQYTWVDDVIHQDEDGFYRGDEAVLRRATRCRIATTTTQSHLDFVHQMGRFLPE